MMHEQLGNEVEVIAIRMMNGKSDHAGPLACSCAGGDRQHVVEPHRDVGDDNLEDGRVLQVVSYRSPRNPGPRSVRIVRRLGDPPAPPVYSIQQATGERQSDDPQHRFVTPAKGSAVNRAAHREDDLRAQLVRRGDAGEKETTIRIVAAEE